MKKRLILFATAFSLILLGTILFIISMSLNNWDFNSLNSIKYHNKTINISENFDNIYILSDIADIDFVLTTDNTCKIVYCEENKVDYNVEIINNTLNITSINNKKWYDYIGITFNKSSLKIYLPKSTYNNITITSDTSNVNLSKDFSFNSLDIALSTGNVSCYSNISKNVNIKTSTGDIYLDGINCENLTSTSSTGDVYLEHVLVDYKINIKTSTGDVEFREIDAKDMYIETSTGDIEGILLSEKIFVVKSNTKKPIIPSTTSGGVCEVITDTGNINIKIK